MVEKKFFLKIRENAVPWKESVTTYLALSKSHKNSRGPAKRIILSTPLIGNKAESLIKTIGSPVISLSLIASAICFLIPTNE